MFRREDGCGLEGNVVSVWLCMLVCVFGIEMESITERKRESEREVNADKKVKRPVRDRETYSECSYMVGRM